MQAGKLNKRVTVEQRVAGSPARTGAGAPATTWTTLRTGWAAIEPLRGREFFAAAQVQSEVKVRIRMRWFDGATAAMRVRYGSTLYYIEAVINPATRNEELQLLCREGVQHA